MIKLEAFKVRLPLIIVLMPISKLPFTVKLLKLIVPEIVPLPEKFTFPVPLVKVPLLVNKPPLLINKVDVPADHVNVPMFALLNVKLVIVPVDEKFTVPLFVIVFVTIRLPIPFIFKLLVEFTVIDV